MTVTVSPVWVQTPSPSALPRPAFETLGMDELNDGMARAPASDAQALEQCLRGLYLSLFMHTGTNADLLCACEGRARALIAGGLRTLAQSPDRQARAWSAALAVRPDPTVRLPTQSTLALAARCGYHELGDTAAALLWLTVGALGDEALQAPEVTVVVPDVAGQLRPVERRTVINSEGLLAQTPFWRWVELVFRTSAGALDAGAVVDILADTALPLRPGAFLKLRRRGGITLPFVNYLALVRQDFQTHRPGFVGVERPHWRQLLSTTQARFFGAAGFTIADRAEAAAVLLRLALRLTPSPELDADGLAAAARLALTSLTDPAPSPQPFLTSAALEADDDPVPDDTGDDTPAETTDPAADPADDPTPDSTSDNMDVSGQPVPDDTMSLVALADGSVPSVNDLLYRKAVLALDAALHKNPPPTVSPATLATLRSWCVYFLFLLKVDETKKVIASLNLKSALKPVS